MNKMLKEGEKYLAVKPAYNFDGPEGELVEFEEKRLEIEVLRKPETCIVDDGLSQIEEPLPTHLKSEDWYFVRNLKTDRKHWFYPREYHLTTL